MNLLTAITELISIFLFTTLFIFVARKVAKKIGLVDKPNYRKRHQGLIPLVGGISVYAGICFTFAIADYYIPHASLYLACAGVLVLVGALDDRFDISVKIRAVIQAAIAVIMMMAGNLHLSSLGFIFGSWELVLGPFGFFLTLFAVWAAINAFNMVDGIDGLLGGLSSVSFAATGIILWFDGQYSLAMWCFAMAAALLALVGVVAEYTRIVPEWVMLILFLVAFFLYGYCIKRAWKVARLVKRIRRRIRRHSGNNPKLTK